MALSILDLVADLPDSIEPPERLLNCLDGDTWRALTEHEIELIIERHYRFAGALYGFERYISPCGRSKPDISPSEEAILADILRRYYDLLFVNPPLPPALPLEESHSDDWDVAVRKWSGLTTDIAPETKGFHEDRQIDWDAAITKQKGS
ncbi:hypothetical protein D3C78_1372760 [compost metagenome]